MYKNTPKYKELINFVNLNIKINYLRTIYNTFKAYLFIVRWLEKYKVKLKFKYKFRLAAHTALVLQRAFTKDNMSLFFAGIVLVRYWDDFYDNKLFTLSELQEIKSTVLYGTPSQIVEASKLSSIYIDLIARIEDLNDPLKIKLLKDFKLQLEILLEGFEFEYSLKLNNLNANTEKEYLDFANRTIGLPYVLRLMSLIFVNDDSTLSEFNDVIKYELYASESIRLANDIVGHEREVVEGKVDIITIRETVNNDSNDYAIEYLLGRILNNLKIVQENIPQDNIFAYIIKSVTYFAIKQYFVADFLYKK